MIRKSHLPVLAALFVGAVGGWVAASGKLDSRLTAEPESRDPATGAASPCRAERCCPGADKPAAVINAHNEKVSAHLQKDGKKPNILVIMGDDIGWFNPSCYHSGVMG